MNCLWRLHRLHYLLILDRVSDGKKVEGTAIWITFWLVYFYLHCKNNWDVLKLQFQSLFLLVKDEPVTFCFIENWSCIAIPLFYAPQGYLKILPVKMQHGYHPDLHIVNTVIIISNDVGMHSYFEVARGQITSGTIIRELLTRGRVIQGQDQTPWKGSAGLFARMLGNCY